MPSENAAGALAGDLAAARPARSPRRRAGGRCRASRRARAGGWRPSGRGGRPCASSSAPTSLQRRRVLGVAAAVDEHRPRRGPVEPHDHPHRRGLAGAVGAEEAGHDARPDGEGEPVDRGLFAVALGQFSTLIMAPTVGAPGGQNGRRSDLPLRGYAAGRVVRRRYDPRPETAGCFISLPVGPVGGEADHGPFPFGVGPVERVHWRTRPRPLPAVSCRGRSPPSRLRSPTGRHRQETGPDDVRVAEPASAVIVAASDVNHVAGPRSRVLTGRRRYGLLAHPCCPS